MCERSKIRNNIALAIEKVLKVPVDKEPKDISVADFPCIFLSTPQESVSLNAQPDLIDRVLEIHIQGFITGPDLANLADKTIRDIEDALNDFEPALSLTQIQTELDTHGEHNICSFLMVFETTYEEKLWE